MKDERGHGAAGRYIGGIHRFARKYFAAQMERLGLPPGAFPLIVRLLRHDGVSQDQLAGDFLVDKSTAARTLAKLEEAGLVSRVADHEDGRVKRVQVTDAARQMAPEVFAAMRAWNDKLLDGFSTQEREDALGYLQRMWENARRHWQDVAEPG
ncbi:MAG: MarR family winged helix-turn-helix transcriptional regulator [Armatimonadota bacterium]